MEVGMMLELIESHQYDHLVYYIMVRAVIVLVYWLFMAASNIVDFFSAFSCYLMPELRLWLTHAHEKLCAGVGAYKIEKRLRPEEALI